MSNNKEKDSIMRVCLTHDVDRVRKTYQYVTKTGKALMKGQFFRAWKMIKRGFEADSPYWGFDTVIDIENKNGVKSTFFFLEESAKVKWWHPKSYKIALGRYHVNEPKVAEMMQYLDTHGWEIGLHGSYYSYDNPELLKREKTAIEDVLGHEIIGVRQHYLNWNDNTWRYQKEVGFKYDSTWGYTRAIGYKGNKVAPFFPCGDADFCEIPLVIMDSCFESDRDRWEKLEQIIAQAEKEEGIIVINFHTNNFDETEFPAYKRNYEQLIETLKAHNAVFMKMNEVYEDIIGK